MQFIPAANAAPSVVGTSTSSYATSYPFQRKSFYAAGRFWAFYYDGANMVYSTSTDGSTWSSATTVRACTSGEHFSVWFDGTYLHYAYAYGSSIYYRRGTPNSDGTITWSADEQTVSTTYNRAYYPMVSVDSNGYVWIGYMEHTGTNIYPYVIKSGNNDGTWGTTPSPFPCQLSTVTGAYYVSVIPLTSDKMLAIYSKGGGGETIKAKRWNGSAWGSEVATTSTTNYGFSYSAVAEGDDVHLVFLTTTNKIVYTKYSYSSNSFGSETILSSASVTLFPVISIDAATNDLYVFWALSNHIYYRKYTASTGTWETAVDWIDESAEVLTGADRLTCFYQAYGNYIGLLYLTKTSSPYNVKFASTLLFPLRLPAYGTTISFAENLTASNIQCFNDKIILINASLGSEPEKANITLTVKNANLTISQLSHNKKFIAELNGQTGTLAELTVTHSLYTHMPGTVAVAGLPLTTPCATKEDFDKYGGNTWYYDTATNTVYVKAVLHSPTSIYIDWNPPPAPYVPTPTPQPTITPLTPTIPLWLIILIIAVATMMSYAVVKRARK
jgi:hypothetical protein